MRLSMARFTKADVTMLVSLSSADGVGAVGVPVSAGEAKGAFRANAFVTVV